MKVKTIISVVAFVIIVVIIGIFISYGFNSDTETDNNDSDENIFVASKINKITIVDGRNGYKAIITKADELKRVEELIINIPFVIELEKEEYIG